MPPSTTSAYDLEVYDPGLGVWHGLMLADRTDDNGVVQPKTMLEGLFSAEGGSEIAKRLLPQVQEDWSLGMGVHYDWAPGLYTRSPGYVCPAGAVTEVAVPTPSAGSIIYHAEFDTDLFMVQVGTATKGGRVLRSVGGSGAFTESLTLTAGEYMRGLLTADDGSGETVLYAFSADAGVHAGRLHAWDGSSWTSTTLESSPGAGDGEFGGWGRAAAASVFWTTSDGIGAHRIVCISGDRTVAYTKPNADPMDAASWVEGVRLGGSRGVLRDIAAARTHIYVSSEDGLWDLNELGESPNLLSYVGGMVQPGNGYAVQYFDGAVFYSLGTGLDRVIVEQNGLLQEIPGMCGPNWGTRAENPVLGYTAAMCVDQGYLVAAISNPIDRKSYICYGKSARSMGVEGSRNPMLWWGPEITFGEDIGVSAMSVSSLAGTTRRLWITTGNNAGTVCRAFWASLPRAGSPLQSLYADGGHTFTTGAAGGDYQPFARLYSLPSTWDDKPSLKIIHQNAIGSRGLGGGAKLVEYDRADPAPGSTEWGTGTDITASPTQTVAPVAPVKGYEIGQRLDFIGTSGADGGAVPFLNSRRTTAWKVAPSFSVWTVDVQWGAGVVNLENGTDETYDPDYIKERLEAIIAYGPTTVRDRRDRRKTAKLEQVLNAVPAFHDDGTKTITARMEWSIIGDVAS